MAIDATHSFRNWCQSRLTSPGIGGSSPIRTGDHGFAIRSLNQLGHGTIWHRTEVSILVLLGQSQVCFHYTSPVSGARGEI